MNNLQVLHPTIGTNGFLTKFGTKKKTKLRVKTATKIKIAFIILLMFSLYANYFFLTQNYVWKCTATFDGVSQNWNLGHLESKNTCNDLIADRLNNLTH